MTILMSHLRYSKTEVVLDRQQWRAVYGHVTMFCHARATLLPLSMFVLHESVTSGL
jgi:hypothetical protein